MGNGFFPTVEDSSIRQSWGGKKGAQTACRTSGRGGLFLGILPPGMDDNGRLMADTGLTLLSEGKADAAKGANVHGLTREVGGVLHGRHDSSGGHRLTRIMQHLFVSA